LQKKILNILLLISVVLLITNILLNIFIDDEEPVVKKGLYGFEIEAKFQIVLQDYGIKDEWIDVRQIDDASLDSLKYVYFLKIPTDIAIPELIRDINKKFDLKEITLTSDEEEINGSSIFKIYSEDKLKLQASIRNDGRIRRSGVNISFVVNGIDDLEESELDEILKSPYLFTATIIPDKNASDLIGKINDGQKNYAVLINDDISDEEYELISTASGNQLREIINNIVSNFEDAVRFIIDGSSDIYNSAVFPYLKNEFANNQRELITINNLISLDDESLVQIISKLDFYTINKESTNTIVFVISADNYLKIYDKLNRYIKRGDKIHSLQNYGLTSE